jgi:dCMP deaminase
MTRTVHCLDEGLALCGYEGGAVPAEWPEGNVWIALSDWPALPGARAAIEDERGELCRSCDARARGLDPPLTSLRIPRLPWDPFFMLHAHLAATRSTCDRGPELLLDAGRHGVGAVFVRDRRIVAGGYNGSPPNEPHCDWLVCPECEWEESPKWFDGTPGVEAVCPECKTKLEGGHLISDGHCVRTLHAEENAILQCAMDGGTPKGATVYTTASPCWDCSKRLVRVGTKARDRAGLGERVTEWIRSNRPEALEAVVRQSSDAEFHCLTIVLFYRRGTCLDLSSRSSSSAGSSGPAAPTTPPRATRRRSPKRR